MSKNTKPIGESAPKDFVDLYGTNYGNFASRLYASIRAETYGNDIGQNSWLTAREQDAFIEHLELTQRSHVLNVGSGSGGPAVHRN